MRIRLARFPFHQYISILYIITVFEFCARRNLKKVFCRIFLLIPLEISILRFQFYCQKKSFRKSFIN